MANPGYRLSHCVKISNVALDQRYIEVSQVLFLTRGKIVQHTHLIASVEKRAN
jgi:hypothetical protein